MTNPASSNSQGTLPQGFRASGVAAGLKSTGAKDVAVIVNDGPHFVGSGVFTSNRIKAAPVIWSESVVKDGEIRAVVINSGGANACTGPQGFADTHHTAEHAAETLGISASDIAICSTGLIGVRLPMDRLLQGVTEGIAKLRVDGGIDCAQAIMTTDSHAKYFSLDFKGAKFFGIIKGAGMLAPSLATMLCVVMTDAVIASDVARDSLELASNKTLNRLDSDGCTSTNDTVLFLSSGASAISLNASEVQSALEELLENLAHQLVYDAEGKSKVIAIKTVGAATVADAEEVGRSCARNNLLKCALHGEDPNWGRVLAAIGTTQALFDPQDIDVSLNGVKVCSNSAPSADRESANLSAELIEIVIDLKSGSHEAVIWTNDLTPMYVHENSAYAT